MRARRGFTLIEVLLVTLLLSFGLLAFLQGVLASTRLHRRSRGMSAAVLLAQDGLERIGALGWAHATDGRTRASLPELMGGVGVYPQEAVSRSGWRFLVVYAREEAHPAPARCVVTCFWAEGDRAFEARNAVRLAAREHR